VAKLNTPCIRRSSQRSQITGYNYKPAIVPSPPHPHIATHLMSNNNSALMTFLAKCDPACPPDSIDYIPRPRRIQGSLEVGLRPRKTSRMLLVGQNGVGKSTELNRLRECTFANEFTIVFPPIDKDMLIDEVGWHDILCYASEALVRSVPTNETHVAYERLREAMKPRTEKVITTRTLSFPEQIAASMGSTEREHVITHGGVPDPTIAQLYRNDTTKTHKHISEGPAQIWDLATAVFREAENFLKNRPAVVILDGFEKLPTSRAKELFYNNLTWLERWPSRLVITGPFAMTAETWYPSVEDSFTNVEQVRAVSCRPGEIGADFLLSIAKHRDANNVIEEDDLHDQLSWSGGIPRQYLQLLTRACQDAVAAGLEFVPKEMHVRARYRLAQRWEYQLTKKDREFLNADSFDTAGEIRNRLLSLNAIIQYDRPDGGVSFGKNPLLGLYLKTAY
jgi:hypothetical protein